MALRLGVRTVILADSAAAIHYHDVARTVPGPVEPCRRFSKHRIGGERPADRPSERIPVVDSSNLVLKSDSLRIVLREEITIATIGWPRGPGQAQGWESNLHDSCESQDFRTLLIPGPINAPFNHYRLD